MMSASLVRTIAPLTPLYPLREGALLGGRYRIASLVSARSGGAQLVAVDVSRDRTVSAHVMAPPTPTDAERGRDAAHVALLAGARRAMVLEGPHVARVLDAGVTADGRPWIVSEHVGGATLAAHLAEHGAMETSSAVDVALAVCDAIAEAHDAGILHLSLEPEAVYVTFSASSRPADVKVTGIGTSSAAATLALGSSAEHPGARAPEQLQRGLAIGVRSDTWAIGVLLHTMLAGSSPFAVDSPSGARLAAAVDDPPLLAGVPDELAEVIERALAREPDRRPATVLELAESIARFSSSPGASLDRIASRRARRVTAAAAETSPVLGADASGDDDSARDLPAGSPPASSLEILVDVAPSIRELVPSEAPGALARTLPPREAGERRSEASSQAGGAAPSRGRTRQAAWLLSAAACVALLALVGTRGARTSPEASTGAAAALAAEPTPVAEPAPVAEPTPVAELPAAAPIVARPAAPAAPIAALAREKRARSAAPPADAPKRAGASASTSSVPGPALSSNSSSKPSPSGSTDELRRFLDDRR